MTFRYPPKARSYQHRPGICPGCAHLLNSTSDPKNRGMPRPHDLTMCVNCGTLLFFDAELRLHPVTAEMVEALPPQTVAELKEQQDRWRARERRNPLIGLPGRRPP
ncbi:MAG TPA: hypothetical protein VMU47_06680 [Caldimonas sp.]|nr:hypothetical protein [Caldimonas sp.]